jgi:hypothetical protein
MKVTSRWYGPQLTKIVLAHMADNLDLAGHYLRDEIRDDLRATVASSPDEHSRPPSEYPYFHTGKLWGSFAWENDRNGLVTRVGSGDPVARYLEFGTSRVVARGKTYPGLAPRPTIRRNLLDHQLDLAQLICRPL